MRRKTTYRIYENFDTSAMFVLVVKKHIKNKLSGDKLELHLRVKTNIRKKIFRFMFVLVSFLFYFVLYQCFENRTGH